MSVHAYRALEEWARKSAGSSTPIYSYLDARTLCMRFDPHNIESGQRSNSIYVGRAVELDFVELLQLQRWSLKCDPKCVALLPITAGALARACATREGYDAWKRWIAEVLLPGRRVVKSTGKEDWISPTELRTSPAKFPEEPLLRDVTRSLRSELDIPEGDLGLDHAAFGCKPTPFCEWLHGKWLEHHVLDAIEGLAISLGLQEYGQSIETKEVEFELDVAAIRGYQLFALSCGTGSDQTGGKWHLKQKLFEIYVRARQLGGDEARVALVCCAEHPNIIEREMRQELHAEGQIRVFGMEDLADLPRSIKEWIESQKGEEYT